ncbi:MAG: hypothetical protein WAS21_10475 [Geminicoccaceae bacterium]
MTTFQRAQVLFVEFGGAGLIASPFVAAALLVVLIRTWFKGR